jgi:outer membrane immunogenic protein
MKKLLLGSMALAAVLAGPAMAADMPVKVKAPPPVVAYDWSGAYVGFHAGYAWQDFDWAFNPSIPGAVNQSFSLSTDNGVYGFHAGFQAQWGQFVLGVETSYSGLTSQWASHLGYGIDFDSFAEAKIHELFTAGGRLGWTPLDRWLLYVSGGYAAGKVESRLVSIATGLEVTAFHTNEWHQGWYVGGGFDYMIHKGPLVDVIAGIEYQHVDLDTRNHCQAFNCNNPADPNRHDLNATLDIVRARLTIKTQGWGWTGPWK